MIYLSYNKIISYGMPLLLSEYTITAIIPTHCPYLKLNQTLDIEESSCPFMHE